MMTENNEINLQTLFAAEQGEIEANGFVAEVMNKTRFLRYRLPALLGALAMVVVALAMLLAPSLQGFALTVAYGMGATLVDLGEGWLAFFLLPVNTVGGLLVVVAKAVRMVQKKFFGGAFLNP